MHRTADHGAEHNALLRGLPEKEHERIASHLELVPLTLRFAAFNPGERIEHLYFPQSGVFSLLALPSAGRAVEVATIGNEGVVGLPVFFGVDSAPQRCFVQVLGEAKRLASRDFLREIPHMPRLRDRLHRYANAFFTVSYTHLRA